MLLRGPVVMGTTVAFFAGMAAGIAGEMAVAQAQPAAATKLTCTVLHVTPNEADAAYDKGQYAQAAQLYQAIIAKQPDDSAAKVRLVSSMIGEGKVGEALALANQYAAASPNDPLMLDAVGEARFRRGEVDEAANAFNKARQLNPCLPRIYVDIARYQALAGNFLAAQKALDLAHSLSPDDLTVTERWRAAHARPLTADQQVDRLTGLMNREGETEDQKKELQEQIKRVKAHSNGDCEMVSPVETAKLPLMVVGNANPLIPAAGAVALDMQFNGKRKRLEVDTGASGLTITKSAAASAGLVAEAEIKLNGIGDRGSVRTYVTHVDTLKLGGMEFHNCEVEVLDRNNAGLETDGLVGTDVFSRWLVTIDTPGRELRLAPLPPRPGDEPGPMQLEIHGTSGNGVDASGVPHDRYVAPEMQDWARVFRRGHNIIFPSQVNSLPVKLFILDTGAFSGSLAPETAKEIGPLRGSDLKVKGISGEMNQTYTIDKPAVMRFANVRQEIRDIPVFDISNVSKSMGVEIAGFLGFKTLRELVISIDYRDDLVKFTYDPNKGFHAH